MTEGNLETRLALLERMADDLGMIVKDHEKRLRWSERVLFYGMGVMGVGGFILNIWARLK